MALPLRFSGRVLLSAAAALLVAHGAASPPASGYANGVSLGGWFLMEPSWMWDEFNAPAEADWVAQLRASSGGDEFALQTFANHWSGYVPDEALDAIAALGIDFVRIPVGFWIVEAPVAVLEDEAAAAGAPRRAVPAPATATMYTPGFSAEGFVTGGMAYLEAALAKLRARGIAALIDLHALPGGASRCASYAGWQVSDPLFWTASPPPNGSVPVASACGGGAGPYYSTRGAAKNWTEVGRGVVRTLAAWAAATQSRPDLAGVVWGIQLANEPALGFPNQQPAVEAFFAGAVPDAQSALDAGGAAAAGVKVVVNFIGPNDVGAGAWLAARVAAGAFDAARLVVDFHNYLNWDGPEDWRALSAKVCAPGTSPSKSPFYQYTAAGLDVLVGEWSASSNLGAAAYTDLDNATIVARLAIFYANQVSLYAAAPPAAPGAVGQALWTLRMGSGWDPRPAPGAPTGRQAPGSAWDRSLKSFGDAVWSLGDLVRVGVAKPLADLAVTGVCQCRGCDATGGG